MARPAKLPTNPSILNISSANTNRSWTLRGISVFLAVSRPCYHGFVIPLLLSILLNDFVASQGTKVLEDREVRSSYCYVTEGTSRGRGQAFQSILKYTGKRAAPEWVDLEQGIVFDFNDSVRVAQAKQTSSRHCVPYKSISLLPHVRESAAVKKGKCPIPGTLT